MTSQTSARVNGLRILHVHQRAEFLGGVERILYDTARGLAASGWPQALLYEHGDIDANFMKVFEMSGRDEDLLLGAFHPDVILLHKVEDALRIQRLTDRFPTVRMVHDHDMVCLRKHKYFPVGARICNRPTGLDCYTHLCFVQKSSPGSRLPVSFASVAAQKRIIKSNKRVKAFIVGSRWMCKELKINGMSAAHIHIVHPIPASLASVKPLPPSKKREILFVGQLIRGKGVDLMLRALALLDGDWHATIVGNGNHLQTCRKIADNLNIASKVDFHGWVEHEELEHFYAKAMLTVVPSRWPEPFGMVGVEAMARGRPVVGFAVGGIPDWLDDGKTGFLVPEADISAMAKAINRLLSHPEEAARLGQAGAAEVARRFGHKVYLQHMMQLLGGMQ